MKVQFKYLMPAATAVALCLAISGPASAGPLTIQIVQTGGPTLTVADNGVGDSDPTPNVVSISSATLTSTFSRLAGTNTVSASNITTADPDRSLSTNVTLKLNAAQPNTTYTITASQTGFVVPASDPRAVDTSASFTFSKETAGKTATFQGGVSTTNTLFGQDVSDTLLKGTSTGLALNSSSANGAGTSFSNGANFYAITNILTENLVAGGQIQDQGTTDITATPEPSTLVLACLAGVPFAIARFRRWGRKDAAQKPLTV